MPSNYKINIFPKAAQDMEGIFDYIAETLCNKAAAIKQINDFETALLRVGQMPESCSLVSNEYVKEKTLRKLIVNSYIIFYRANKKEKEIEVVRVLYGMMNYIDIL